MASTPPLKTSALPPWSASTPQGLDALSRRARSLFVRRRCKASHNCGDVDLEVAVAVADVAVVGEGLAHLRVGRPSRGRSFASSEVPSVGPAPVASPTISGESRESARPHMASAEKLDKRRSSSFVFAWALRRCARGSSSMLHKMSKEDAASATTASGCSWVPRGGRGPETGSDGAGAYEEEDDVLDSSSLRRDSDAKVSAAMSTSSLRRFMFLRYSL
mmetsp:Transcript_58631/g.163582  ORF Transcript_58631/g.163582 Transcript_58631/m.163582 type:complete len:218 (-) Transcript_58631:1306-1959(-)